MNEDFNKIVINDKNIYSDTKNYIQRIAPEKADIVSYHSNGTHIFDQFGVTKQVKGSFGKTVNMNSGAYLIIEHTEALHVIDVNSGYKSVSNNQEQNALETNLEAADEIARQLRLRDMQITRQRMKPEMNINTQEVCPTCNGTGKIASTLILEDEMEKNLNYLITHKHKNLTLAVHPIVHAYLTKGWLWSKAAKWKRKFGQTISIRTDTNYHLTEFHFYDGNNEEIKL